MSSTHSFRQGTPYGAPKHDPENWPVASAFTTAKIVVLYRSGSREEGSALIHTRATVDAWKDGPQAGCLKLLERSCSLPPLHAALNAGGA